MGKTASLASLGSIADTSLGFRNRIINGDMRIDQRNAGASVNMSAAVVYTVDRWWSFEDTDGTMTAQQSSTAPTGFTNSLLCTTTSADASLGATQRVVISQAIEGYNIADLGWGTASAQAVTLSFWVRSSLTGAFGGAVKNSGPRSYPFTYTISSANTWEQKTITIAGDTSGTWLATNGVGMNINFGLGVGSTYSGTAGAWSGSDLNSATGAVSVVGTNGATFYITGVQLEAGSVASPFERRDYGRELMMAQRYYHKQGGLNYLQIGAFAWDGTSNCSFNYQLPVSMRSVPTFSKSGTFSSANGSPNIAGIAVDASASTTKVVNLITVSGSGGVNGYSTYIRALNDSSAYFDFSAEL